MEPIQVALRKQYTRMQRTKPSLQIKKKLSVRENVASEPWFFNKWCGKTTVRGTMEAGKNSVIYVGLISGPNKADDTCGKMTVTGTMEQGSTVVKLHCFFSIRVWIGTIANTLCIVLHVVLGMFRKWLMLKNTRLKSIVRYCVMWLSHYWVLRNL
jgi:hypothetical protein